MGEVDAKFHHMILSMKPLHFGMYENREPIHLQVQHTFRIVQMAILRVTFSGTPKYHIKFDYIYIYIYNILVSLNILYTYIYTSPV